MAGPQKPTLDALLADLAAERDDLRQVLGPLDADGWAAPTPAEPWTVRDQVVHLGYFDRVATLPATDPAGFEAELRSALADYQTYMRDHLEDGPPPGGDVIGYWARGAAGFDRAYRDLDPASRLSWFAVQMSARSMVTARLTETWTHGQDVCDGLGVSRVPTARLRHIAHLAVRARPYGWVVRDRQPPAEPIRVELTAPDGSIWTFEPEGSQYVQGSALDFCLVLNQRRHVDDTGLVAHGADAQEWLLIGQAFAGPPGPGRRPGQFAGHRRIDSPIDSRIDSRIDSGIASGATNGSDH
ncbi:MAG: TIGR03084 family metal-binding protein [Carbonactinosporaceae bacterium]